MINKLIREIWKPLIFPGWKELRNRYAASNHGRIASYQKDIFKEGKLLTGSITTGYRTLNLHIPGVQNTIYIHRELAKLFLKKKSRNHKYVIHLDHNKLNNNVRNLKWVTTEQMIEHQQSSPVRIAYKVRQANRSAGLRLTAAQVKTIKKIINSKKRNITISALADKYKVSEMTIYRIKSGENWARI